LRTIPLIAALGLVGRRNFWGICSAETLIANTSTQADISMWTAWFKSAIGLRIAGLFKGIAGLFKGRGTYALI
jgi:hypothetical protein